MTEAYEELLPRNVRCRELPLNHRSGAAIDAATTLGVLPLLQSEHLRRLAAKLSGVALHPDPGMQVICYAPGDYVGPHNDHHPEDANLRGGYVDAHIMISEPGVQSQLLVYEREAGFLSAIQEVGSGCAVGVYRLPFWHYTTPLVAKPGRRCPRRWLLLASFEIDTRRRRRN